MLSWATNLVNEEILAPISGSDEAEALGGVEPLDGSCGLLSHGYSGAERANGDTAHLSREEAEESTVCRKRCYRAGQSAKSCRRSQEWGHGKDSEAALLPQAASFSVRSAFGRNDRNPNPTENLGSGVAL